MEIKEVYENVCQVIELSTGTPNETIKLENTLFNDLAIDSIDLVDILYELENLYDIELKVSDIEARAKSELGDIPYEVDGVITKEGLKTIKMFMTEIDPKELKEGLTVNNVIQLFSVHSLCKIVMYRLESEGNK